MKKSFVIAISSSVAFFFAVIVLVWLIRPYYAYLKDDFVIPSSTRTPPAAVQISYDEKVQILSEVIKQFPDMEPKSKNKDQARKKSYVLKESVPLPSFAAQLPQIPGLTIELITDPEIDAQKQEREVEYYEFRDFRAIDGDIVLPVIWMKKDKDSVHTTGFDFTVTRIADKWVVNRKVTGVSVAEHP